MLKILYRVVTAYRQLPVIILNSTKTQQTGRSSLIIVIGYNINQRLRLELVYNHSKLQLIVNFILCYKLKVIYLLCR